MNLDPDFEDFISLLNKHNVKYLIVGGYAMAFHGRPRYTGDLDIWIDISKSNANKMVNVIKEFGFSSLGFSSTDFLSEQIINQIGYPPLRIDILTTIDGISFKEAYKNRVQIKIGNISTFYIGLNQLIQNKKASGRLQDLADIEALKKKP